MLNLKSPLLQSIAHSALHPRLERGVAFVTCAALLACGAMRIVASQRDLSNIHPDESLFVAVGARDFSLLVRGDLKNEFWADWAYSWGAPQPTVGKLLIGLGTNLAGFHDVPLPGLYDYTRSLEWNRENERVSSNRLIAAGRIPIAICGFVTLVAFLALAWTLVGPLRATLALAIMVFGTLVIGCGGRAMIDAPMLCFGLLSLYCVAKAAMRDSPSGVLSPWLTVAGVLAGLAVGSKLNGLTFLAVGGIVILYARARGGWRDLFGFVAASVFSFVALNPLVIFHPIEGVSSLLGMYSPGHGLGDAVTDSLGGKALALVHSIHVYGPLRAMPLPVDTILFFLGAGALIDKIYRDSKNSAQEFRSIFVACWCALNYLMIGVWLPNSWDRYFLPLAPCNAILEALGLVFLLELAKRTSTAVLTRWHRNDVSA